jgi:type II secretory pathway pseudopilin PulG
VHNRLADIREAQAGLTMVELVVVVVMLAMIIGASMDMVLDGVRSTSKVVATDQAGSAANDFLNQLSSDLKSASSPGRDPNVLGSSDALRQYLIGTATPPADADPNDIAKAQATELWLRVDTLPEPVGTEPQTECVGYFVAENNLIRNVYSDWKTCPNDTGVPLQSEIMVPNIGDVPTGLFSYVLRHNAAATKVPLDPNDCVTESKSAANGRERAYVVMVKVNVEAIVKRGTVDGENKMRSGMDLRLRLVHEYQHALGCAF